MRVNTALLIVGLLLILLSAGTLITSIGCGMIGWVIGSMLAKDFILKNGK
jgi:hypothetical protein